MVFGVRAKKACEIAQLDPARFKDMVHAGHYPCVPATRPRSARIFDLDQVVALAIFGELLSLTLSPEEAGRIACSAYGIFAGKSDVDRLILRRDAFGEWVVEKANWVNLTNLPSRNVMLWDISEFREQVGDVLEWEQQFGTEDDSAAS